MPYRLLGLLGLGLALVCGCDLVTFPEQAEYTGADSARASVALSADAMVDRDDADAVVVEVVDLVLHRPADDGWVMLGTETIRVDLVDTPRSHAVTGVPLRRFAYDRLAFGLNRVRIESGGTTHDADLLTTEVELAGDFAVPQDVLVQLQFDLDASIIGDASTGFAFDPVVEAAVAAR